MTLKSEQLLESLLDIERSRQQERDLRLESESLLEGLRRISEAGDKDELFQTLIESLQYLIYFQQAFILELEQDMTMTVLATTLDELAGTVWEPGLVFKKALTGRPVAAYDINLIPEWQQLPKSLCGKITSALHIGLHGGSLGALLIITHDQKKYFGVSDVKKAKRFSPIAAQALWTIELQQAVIQRDRFFNLSMDVMAIIDPHGKIKQFNDGWTAVLGYDGDDLQGTDIFSFIHPDDSAFFKEVLSILINSDDKQMVEMQFYSKSKSVHWLSCSLASYQNENLFYLVARDITDRVTYEKLLAHQAGHDELTGLKNRAEFMEELSIAFNKTTRQPGYSFAVFFLDLNKFKEVNDTLGHDVGDKLLIFFADTLQEVMRNEDIVARLGGDEFTILICSPQSDDSLGEIANRIHLKCSEPLVIDENKIKVSTSIGIATSSRGYENEQILLQAADQAMYRAKQDKSIPYVIMDKDQ